MACITEINWIGWLYSLPAGTEVFASIYQNPPYVRSLSWTRVYSILVAGGDHPNTFFEYNPFSAGPRVFQIGAASAMMEIKTTLAMILFSSGNDLILKDPTGVIVMNRECRWLSAKARPYFTQGRQGCIRGNVREMGSWLEE